MPPKRSTRGSTAAQRTTGQGTLSFSKGQANRITKQAPSSKAGKKLDSDALSETISIAQPPAATDPLSAPRPSSPTTVLGGRASPSPEPQVAASIDPEEQADTSAALALPASKINAYWRAKETARKAARVHQDDLTLGEKILREWDMSGQFGPCIGISRERRWRRARRLGLEPPVEVLAVLLGVLDRGEEAVEGRAYVDVLMGNRFEVAV